MVMTALVFFVGLTWKTFLVRVLLWSCIGSEAQVVAKLYLFVACRLGYLVGSVFVPVCH